MAPSHWNAVVRMATESGCRVVVPIYTLAPLSTAREWEQSALDLIVDLSTDERYTGYQFIHMGDSAGGWMTMRLYQAMCDISLGEESERRDAIDKALERMDTGIMISPLINPEINDELIEASKNVSLVFYLWSVADTDPGLLAVCQPLQFRKPSLDERTSRFPFITRITPNRGSRTIFKLRKETPRFPRNLLGQEYSHIRVVRQITSRTWSF